MAEMPTERPSGLYEAMAQETDKQEWVNWLFANIAPKYDLANTIMSVGWHSKWKRRLVDYAEVEPEHRVLDLCCGTGDVTFLLAERPTQADVDAHDINPMMMAEAEKKRPEGVSHVRFVEGSALELPFEDASFDRVTCSYGGRSFPDFPKVLGEISRVLKPGGQYWNLDFGRPPNAAFDKLYRGYMQVTGAMLGVAMHGDPRTYMFIPVTMAHYGGQRWLAEQMKAAGFEARYIETRMGIMGFNQGIKPL